MARRKANRRFYVLALGALIAALAIMLVVIISTTGNKISPVSSVSNVNDVENVPVVAPANVFAQGVTVDGMALGGKPFDEGRRQVEEAVEKKLGEIAYTLKDDDISGAISGDDMGARANIDEVIQSAMKYSPGQLGDEAQLSLAAGQDFSVNFSIDRTALVTSLGTIAEAFKREPVEPSVKATLTADINADFDITPGQDGRTLNVEAMADKLIAMFESGEYSGEVAPEYDVIETKLDTEFLRANTKKRATFQTRFRYSSSDEVVQNRCFNIDKAASILNGTVVMPGEEFTFNGHVGMRTEKGGWKLANGISGGKEYTLQAGGGICQVSTTLYNALLSANLEVTDRKAHSIPSDYAPKGLDATVDSSGIDLKFRNNTGAPIYIFAYWTEDKESSRRRYMHVSLYGEPLPDGVEYKPRSEILEEIIRDDVEYIKDSSIPEGYQLEKVVKHDGYVAEAYLDKYENGKLVDSVLIGKDKYRGNNAEVAVGTGDPSKSPPAGAVLMDGYSAPPAQGDGTAPAGDAPAEEPQPTPQPEPTPAPAPTMVLPGSPIDMTPPPAEPTATPWF